MKQYIAQEFFTKLIDRNSFVIVRNTMPPRDPDEDEDEDDDEEEESSVGGVLTMRTKKSGRIMGGRTRAGSITSISIASNSVGALVPVT